MTEFTLTRRTFLGASILVLPGVRALASLVLVRDAEFLISFHESTPLSPITITTFTNGSLRAAWQGELLEVVNRGKWTSIQGVVNGGKLDMSVRIPAPGTLDLRWLQIVYPEYAYWDSFVANYDEQAKVRSI